MLNKKKEGKKRKKLFMSFFFSCCTETIPNRDVKTEMRTERSCLCTVTPLVNTVHFVMLACVEIFKPRVLLLTPRQFAS